MLLEEKNRQWGTWLFRWRSYLPLVFLTIILIGLLNLRRHGATQMPGQPWILFCFGLSMLGLLIRAYTIGHTPFGTSGRNTRNQVAESLNKTGIYSIVRNPLYLGNFFMMFGVVMSIRIWSIGLLFILVFWIYYEKIILAEEHFLKNKFDNVYISYADKTPAFVPNFKLYTPSTLGFSLRNVLKREYSGFFGVIATFTALQLFGNIIVLRTFKLDKVWIIIFVIGLAIYLTLRTLKKKTTLLHVKGR